MEPIPIRECKEKLGLASAPKPVIAGIVVLLAATLLLAAHVVLDAMRAPALTIDTQDTEAAADGQGADPAAASEEPATIFVHVSGSVREPGLVELPAGSRVADAVQAAGGFTDEADASSVNLARQLSDGEQVIPLAQGAAAEEGATGEPAAATASGKVSINRATAQELTALPGIGDATAQKIVADREANGPFSACEDLMRVSGIGEKKYASLADLITL